MLAESPQIPTEVVVVVLVLFLLFVAALLSVVVGGLIAAYRCGRGPSRTKARVVAAIFASLEGLALVWALLVAVDDPDAAPAFFAVAAVMAATAGAFGLGVWLRRRDELGR